MTPEQKQIRLRAKRQNERVKLMANLLNAVAIAVIAVTIVIPSVADPQFLLTAKPYVLLSVALVLHIAAQVFLGLLQSED